ncbi:bone morphogenetic protein [Mactra antiquata]
MSKKTLYLFLVLILGTVSDVFCYNFDEYEGRLEASTIFKPFLEGRNRIVKRRKPIVNYIRDVYEEFAVENELSYQCDPHNPSLQTVRGHFGHELNIIFNTQDIYTTIDRLEFVVYITNRLHQLITQHNTDVKLYINNKEYKAVRLSAKSGKSYFVFDISSAVDKLQYLSINRHITVNKSKIRLSKTNQPVLVTFNGGTRNPLVTPCDKRVARNIDGYSDLSSFYPRSERRSNGPSFSCQKRSWTMDMTYFQFDWYIEPRFVKADICSGNCETPLTLDGTNSTNYSYVKNLWHVQTFFLHRDVPRACCVPVDYLPLWVIVVEESGDTRVKSIPNMRVKYCGCR